MYIYVHVCMYVCMYVGDGIGLVQLHSRRGEEICG